jgi:hypothetical protein
MIEVSEILPHRMFLLLIYGLLIFLQYAPNFNNPIRNHDGLTFTQTLILISVTSLPSFVLWGKITYLLPLLQSFLGFFL